MKRHKVFCIIRMHNAFPFVQSPYRSDSDTALYDFLMDGSVFGLSRLFSKTDSSMLCIVSDAYHVVCGFFLTNGSTVVKLIGKAQMRSTMHIGATSEFG